MIENADYFVRYTTFPKDAGTHGMVLLNDDTTYSIYIDKNATPEQQKRSLKHEIDHINDDDMHGDKSIAEIESALEREKTPHTKTAEELSLDWLNSWQRCMERCREEMKKNGIEPMGA